MEFAQLTGRRLGLLEVHVRNAIRTRLVNDRGEGVISMAIAILIVAVIGAAMYAAFSTLADGAAKKAGDQLESIGD